LITWVVDSSTVTVLARADGLDGATLALRLLNGGHELRQRFWEKRRRNALAVVPTKVFERPVSRLDAR
jgi:hypothetical protein